MNIPTRLVDAAARAFQAADDALKSLHWLTACRCDPAYTERKLHGPDCLLEYREDVDEALAAAQRRGWDQAIAALREMERDSVIEAARGEARRAAEYLTAVRDTPAEGGTEHG